MNLQFLSHGDILRIYKHLVDEFADSGDPIEPVGIRDENLLASAVDRQHVALGGVPKYSSAYDSAATLAFGICNNHPFYNGNKRTALVSILVHLDRNKLTLFGTGQDELYDFMLNVASHTVVEWESDYLGREWPDPPAGGRFPADREVESMAAWLRLRAAPVKRGERRITYRELRRVLRTFGYDLVEPNRSFISVVRVTEDKLVHVDSIIYPGDHREVGVSAMKRVREKCRLREEDGVDTEIFYDQYLPVDDFIQKYRIVLRRLSHT